MCKYSITVCERCFCPSEGSYDDSEEPVCLCRSPRSHRYLAGTLHWRHRYHPSGDSYWRIQLGKILAYRAWEESGYLENSADLCWQYMEDTSLLMLDINFVDDCTRCEGVETWVAKQNREETMKTALYNAWLPPTVEPDPADNAFVNAKRSLCFLWDKYPGLSNTIDRNTEVWKKVMGRSQPASEVVPSGSVGQSGARSRDAETPAPTSSGQGRSTLPKLR